MKKFAANNLLFLRKAYPNIYHLVRNRTANQNRVRPGLAKNGQSIIAIRDEHWETWLNSRYNPELEASRWAESLRSEVEQKDNLLIFGFGFGYHADAVMRAFPDKKLFIYEPDLDVFLTAIERIDLRPILDRKQVAMFAIGEDPGVHELMLFNILSQAKGSFGFLAPSVYRKWYAGIYQKFTDHARTTTLSYQVNENSIRHFRKEWIENVFVNLARNLYTRSFRGLLNSCVGVPAVIAGSGPSLSMEMDRLKAIRDRILLIAAGSSIQSLMRHGIEPDLIVSIDGGKANQRVFAHFDVSHIPFLYIPIVKHTSIRDERSPLLLHAYFDNDALSCELMDLGEEDVVFESSATVSGTAIQAAVLMGCQDIVLIGQDFSYPGDQMYAHGVSHLPDQWQKKKVENTELMVPNVAGGQNRTDSSMIVLKHNTEKIMSGFPQVRFYNASPIGVVIEHTSLLSLDELPVRLSAESRPNGWFKSLVQNHTKPISPERKDRILNRVDRYAKELHEWIDLLRKLELNLRSISDMLSKGLVDYQLNAWFVDFQIMWDNILNHDVFVKIFSQFLDFEYNNALRHWPEVLQEKNGERKLVLLLTSITPLINAIGELVPICEKGLRHLQQFRA